jgi:methionyl-tRNA formyltransferase
VLKILFMGTPDFSLSALEAVYNSGNELIAVVTQPDKPKGRGKQTTPPPVKEWVLQRDLGIPIYQPQKIRGDARFMDEIRQLGPDLVVTAAFGQILPKEFLDIPPLGCINVHASLLPEYRGASPIQQVLIDGREKTGISIQYMDVGMDTGDVILQEEVPIDKHENAGQLFDKLAVLGGSALSKVLKLFENGKPAGIPQDHDKATYCSKIDKSMGEIHWEKKASEIRNLVRGLTPWPGTFTFLHGKRIKVWKADEWEYFTNNGETPGTIIKADQNNGLVVACGESALRILELQAPGGRPMPDLDYLRGNPVEPGTVLGV